jgi:two-component system, OmpR family, response regulator
MKALVVEDNRRLASFLVRALTEEGWIVDSVGDGETALDQIDAIEYELVVLDWMLPGIDGVTVTRELRRRGRRMPILMLTARSEVGERIVGLDAGADDYLPKPFDLGELLARARSLVRRSGAEAIIRVGPLVVDQMKRVVTVGAAPLDLTSREFAVLSLLASAAGRVVARSEILSKVWLSSADTSSNVVEVHVSRVREKLGTHAKIVETIRGVGYRLNLEANPP